MDYQINWNEEIPSEILEWFQEEWNFPENDQHFDGLDATGTVLDLAVKAGDSLLNVAGGFVDGIYHSPNMFF
jgi:hypothetical protein